MPCGKCLECRLDYARQWAVRCVHEAAMHERNCFITLTYSDENLKSPKLDYTDFQKFMKKLRKVQNAPIGVFVTGEYGDKTKRPHWHAILFNYCPSDSVLKYTNDRGDRVFESETLSKLWGNGIAEFGSVTFHSAGYCARYAAKKLGHGRDGEHEFEPISKKSNKHAIGKKWIEKYWPDVFNYGHVILADGKKCTIPRYYEKWFKENRPNEWLIYTEKVKLEKIAKATRREKITQAEYFDRVFARGSGRTNPKTPNQVRNDLLKAKFKMLQDNLKL